MLGLAGTKRPRTMEGGAPPPHGAPSILYYSGQICNGGTEGSVRDDPICASTDQRGAPLLADATDYFAAFVRLHVNGTLYLPAFRPVIMPSQPDRDLTIYSVTLTSVWSGLTAAPEFVDMDGPAGGLTFSIGAQSAVDGMPLMTRVPITLPATGLVGVANLVLALNVEVDFWRAGNPLSPWGAPGVPSLFSIPTGTQRIVFTPPAGTTDLLTLHFDEAALSAADRAHMASLVGSEETTYVPASPTSSVMFPNYPNGVASRVVTSPTFTSQVYVRWIPEDVADPALPAPPGPEGMDSRTNPAYYYGYSYDHVAGLFNTAFSTAATAIGAQFSAWWVSIGAGAVPPPLQAAAPPVLTYDPSSRLFTLTAPAYGYGPNRTSAGRAGPGGSETWTAAFNTNAFNLFSSLPAVFEEVRVGNAGRDVVVSWDGAELVAAAGAPASAARFRLREGYVSTDAFWSPVGAIGVQSTYITALEQMRAPPIVLGTSTITSGPTTATTSFDRTVVDFTAAGTTATDARTTVTYVPDANYRFLEMRPGPLAAIDITVAWIDRLTGDVHPLRLPPQASCTYVIAFFHKSAM